MEKGVQLGGENQRENQKTEQEEAIAGNSEKTRFRDMAVFFRNASVATRRLEQRNLF